MATLASDIVNQTAIILQDAGKARWTSGDLLAYLDEAQQAVVQNDPTANVVTSEITLVAGTRQTIPADGIALIDVVQNYTGGGPGTAIRQVDRDILNATDPNWHSGVASTTVDEYVADELDRTVFYVNPPQPGTPDQVRIRYVAVPATPVLDQNIALGDEYINTLIEFMLYRAYSRDAEYSGPDGKANEHLVNFNNMIG